MPTVFGPRNPFSVSSPSSLSERSDQQPRPERETFESALSIPPLPVTSIAGPDTEPERASRVRSGCGRACAFKALGGESLTREDIALLATERQPRVDFFRALQAGQNKDEVCAVLRDILAADGPESQWFLRKTAFEDLRKHSSAPLTTSLSVFLATKNSALRARILESFMKDLSFPLTPEARREVAQLGPVGGQLCNSLLLESPTSGERPHWVMKFPRFVRAWILACSAVGVEHGVNATSLNRFSREMGGPLNEWQIRVAVEPMDPLTWGGMQAAVRRLIRH